MFVGDGNVTLGGYTVLYPEGKEQYVFPVRTSWEAEQQLTVGDTLMPVEWGLDFWEYGWGGQINYCAGSTCEGTSFLWQYDSTTHSGSIRINGMQHPFTYDPTTDLITLDYSTLIYGTTDTIGGSLQFHREDDLPSRGRPKENLWALPYWPDSPHNANLIPPSLTQIHTYFRGKMIIFLPRISFFFAYYTFVAQYVIVIFVYWIKKIIILTQ